MKITILCTKLVSYVYDAWGNIATTQYHKGGASTTAVNNPFRYRGYYYDTDLGLYYMNCLSLIPSHNSIRTYLFYD